MPFVQAIVMSNDGTVAVSGAADKEIKVRLPRVALLAPLLPFTLLSAL